MQILQLWRKDTEFIQRLNENYNLPMITSCSPGWVRYVEANYPENIKYLSSCKSPHEMFGALIKTYYAEKNNIDPEENICSICNAMYSQKI